VMAVMIRRALDTLPSVVEGFLCRETDVSYVLKPDTATPTLAGQIQAKSGSGALP
jgi:hypothetical protein